MSNFTTIAEQIGRLVDAKNTAYGSSFEDAGKIMRLLYPQGVALEQLDDALLITRILDKLKRIATARDAFGESPYRDIAGYGILGAALHEQRKAGSCSTSAEDQHAATSAKAPTASAAKAAGTRPRRPTDSTSDSRSSKASASARRVATVRRASKEVGRTSSSAR